MPEKRFTILVIPEGSHQVRRFGVRMNMIKGAAFAAVILLLGLAVLITDYVLTNFDRNELERLQVENLSQREELHRLVVKLEDLRQEIVVLAQNDAKVRVMAKLSAPKGDSMVGVGGPATQDDVKREFSDIQQRIDEVRRQIDLRRESQEEIQGILNDQRSLLAAKPVGWPVKGWLTSSFGGVTRSTADARCTRVLTLQHGPELLWLPRQTGLSAASKPNPVTVRLLSSIMVTVIAPSTATTPGTM